MQKLIEFYTKGVKLSLQKQEISVITSSAHQRAPSDHSTTFISIGGPRAPKLARVLPSGCAAEFKLQLVGSGCPIPYTEIFMRMSLSSFGGL